MDTINQYFRDIDPATLIAWGWKILAALLIFIIGRWVAKLIRRSISKLMAARNLDPMLVNFLGAILYSILLVAVVIAAVSQLGIQTTPLIAVLGAAGLAVGLALQNSLGNFAAGVMLIFFRPFTKGDYVEAGGTSGTVDEVGIFNTMLDTPDNRRVIVPNGQITSDTITNYSAHDTRRIDMIIGVDYGDDLKVARSTLEKTLDVMKRYWTIRRRSSGSWIWPIPASILPRGPGLPQPITGRCATSCSNRSRPIWRRQVAPYPSPSGTCMCTRPGKATKQRNQRHRDYGLRFT